MNVFVREIGRAETPRELRLSGDRIVVEDNVGESIHVHVGNTRIEFSIDDYLAFADCIEAAERGVERGDY
ncbi:hypothetical protein [Halorussus aquaticus]|uniref:Uncharacterized protein n=1 Tax=Halorussus aquaticus TaxID=2953748 RepID=A0ABD5Q3T3_9EURY|nr:hypothetical protein [Halorussus aquaticus]